MARYEYRVVPAPKKAGKVKGVKGTEARFAHELSALMNDMAAEAWEYQRTDTLPCEERAGWGKRVTMFQTMLVFRRAIAVAEATSRDGAPSADAIATIHAAAPAPEPRRTGRRAPEPPLEPASEPPSAREEVATLPSFRSAKAKDGPAIAGEDAPRVPRLGSARRGDGTPTGPTLVKR